MKKLSAGILGMLLMLGGMLSTQAAVTHRYSFSEAGGTNVTDSVGGASGYLVSQGGAVGTLGGGVVDLPGGPGGAAPTNAYVYVPGSLVGINTYTSLTLEVWSARDTAGGNSMLVAFGDTWTNGFGRDYLFVASQLGDGTTRGAFAVTPDQNAPWADETGVGGPGFTDGVDHLYTLVIDGTNSLSYYIDGALQGTDTDFLNTSNQVNSLSGIATNFLYMGWSAYSVDPATDCSINEFRIHNTALSALDVAINNNLGANDASGNEGTLISRDIAGDSTCVVNGTKPYSYRITYSLAGTVEFSTDPDLVWSTSDSNKATITSGGVASFLDIGTVDIVGSYAGAAATNTVTVTELALAHRYSFNGAASGAFDFAEPDLVGSADGTVFFASRNGTGQVTLDSALSGYVDLPNGIMSDRGAISFEAWVTPLSPGGGWQRILDFGSTTIGEVDEFTISGYSGANQTYFFLASAVGGAAAVRAAVFEPPTPEASVTGPAYSLNVQQHLVATYNAAAGELHLYQNGIEVGTPVTNMTAVLGNFEDVNNWIGRSQWDGDAFADAVHDEFRIYDGVLPLFDVAVNSALGPNVDPFTVTNLGSIIASSLILTSPTNTLITQGLSVQTIAYADFTSVSNVPINGFAGVVFSSSDTNVVTVNDNGLVTPGAVGTGTVSVAFMSQTNGLLFTVEANPKPTTLVHRYTFNETSGTTVNDVIGTIDGTIIGTNSTWGGGELTLPGTGISSATNGINYVDFPDGFLQEFTNDVTLEIWFTWNGGAVWQRILDFGSSTTDPPGTGVEWIFINPADGAAPSDIRIDIVDGVGGQAGPWESGTPAPVGGQTHIVLTYDPEDNISRFYVDGALEAQTTAAYPLSDVTSTNNWLGRSQWGGDAMYNGSYNEIRWYTGIMTGGEVAESLAWGPDYLPSINAVAIVGTNVDLSWQENPNETGFGVDGITDLGTGSVWTATGVPVISVDTNGNKSASVPLVPSTETYYRLSK